MSPTMCNCPDAAEVDLVDLKDRLRAQWVESVEDWIHQNQVIRTGMLDSWMLNPSETSPASAS